LRFRENFDIVSVLKKKVISNRDDLQVVIKFGKVTDTLP